MHDYAELAFLAARNFTSSDEMLEAKRGWANTVSTKQDWSEITEGLGERYETALNAYRPFACGIVIHPVIDGCIHLREEHHLRPENIDRVELRVHPHWKPGNPMTDGALTAKAADLMDGVLPFEQANKLIEACWKIETLDRASVLARMATPK